MENTRDLYLQERQQEILRVLDQAGRVSVAQLSRRFGVSEVTIRSDLQALAERNLLVRTHGGAVSPDRSLLDISLTFRQQQQVQEKDRIGRVGASLVAKGDAIFLDSSSTALAIARHLKDHRFLTVITNALAVAQEMLNAPGVTVVMVGGRLRSDTASVVSSEGLDMLRQFNIQKGFFGAHGISLAEGLTDVSAEEAEIKRLLVAMCRQVIAVLDATKWGQVGLTTFASIEDVDMVITSDQPPTLLVEQVRQQGIQVIVARD